MSLIESHCHHTFDTKLIRSEKVTYEPLGEEEGLNIEPRFGYHYTYQLTFNYQTHVWITFMCIGEPKNERVNLLLKNIIKRIYKLTFVDGRPNRKTSPEQYEQIIKDSINYTSFKHSYYASYVEGRNGYFKIRVD